MADTTLDLMRGLALLLAALVPGVAAAWWDDDWQFRKAIDYDPAIQQDGAALSDGSVLVPVRLHAGNFAYFEDARPDGADLRFVAADDSTPLDFAIERWDAVSGIGLVWVRVPVPGPRPDAAQIWMYYGNPDASAPGRAALYSLPTVAAYRFVEPEGMPRDSSGLGHDATRSTATLGAPGALDLGIELDATAYVALPAAPLLTIDTKRGYTFAAWVRPAAGAGPGLLFSQTGDAGFVELLASGESARLRVVAGETTVELQAALTPDAWQMLSFTVGDELRLFVDGRLAGSTALAPLALGGPPRIGGREGVEGFTGRIDGLTLHSALRTPEWHALTYRLQSPDGSSLEYGADESRDSGAGIGAELRLVYDLFGRMGANGWVVITLTVLLGLVSADVAVVKLLGLRRLDRADADFRKAFASRWREDADQLASDVPRAAMTGGGTAAIGLQRVYEAALDEVASLASAGPALQEAAAPSAGRPTSKLSAQGLESVRARVDAEVVEESHRLGRRLVLMTLAVAGGPFLGLFGTVFGVMLTFAAVAKSGDVNVNTIAPGVASALLTTVVGLLVAIPSMFAYNIVSTRIATKVAELEVFADQLLMRLSASGMGRPVTEARHAA